MATPSQRVYMIERIRANARQFITTVAEFKALGEEMTLQDVAATLVDTDFNGANLELKPPDLLEYVGMLATLLGSMSIDDQKKAYKIKPA